MLINEGPGRMNRQLSSLEEQLLCSLGYEPVALPLTLALITLVFGHKGPISCMDNGRFVFAPHRHPSGRMPEARSAQQTQGS